MRPLAAEVSTPSGTGPSLTSDVKLSLRPTSILSRRVLSQVSPLGVSFLKYQRGGSCHILRYVNYHNYHVAGGL